MNVYVVFVNELEPAWLRFFLAPGFRHCFMAASFDDKHWVIIDHLYPYTSLKVLDKEEIETEVEKWLESGYTVIHTTMGNASEESSHFGVQTCVETTKRFMKINSWFIQTPWQLYAHIVQNLPYVVIEKKKAPPSESPPDGEKDAQNQ